MQVVPLQPVPNQALQVQLANQPVGITLQQTAYGLFINIYLNSTLVVGGVWCQNLNRIVRDAYLGLVGDLAFIDTQGNADPDYTGLGGSTARFQLMYLTEAELEQ